MHVFVFLVVCSDENHEFGLMYEFVKSTVSSSVILMVFVHLQIVGEIKAAREALVEVTNKLRNYLYQDFYPKDISPSPRIANSSAGSAGQEAGSNNNINSYQETGAANHLPTASTQNVQIVAPPAQATKVN